MFSKRCSAQVFGTIALSVSAGILGCGSGEEVIPLAPVTGIITDGSNPVVGAIIEFFPADGRASVAKTGEGGTYTMKYGDEEGVVIGSCRIQITPNPAGASAPDDSVMAPPMDSPPSIIQIKDMVTVVDGENSFDFDVSELSVKTERPSQL